MDGNQVSSYHTVLEETTKDKLLCYVKKTPETYTICVTDATDVWSTDVSEDLLSQFRQMISLKSTEDYMMKIRSALDTGSSTVQLQQPSGGALLRLGSGPADLSASLAPLDQLQARAEVKELLFGMAAHLGRPQVAIQSVSHGKSQYRRHDTDFGPRAQRKTGPKVPVVKRMAGDSLINPGTKKKRQTSGVAFDDVEED
ncbi:hypothetical protein NHX12_028787 [Muraenolepis orangiensis]|uniref:PAXX non-homologous end joining factor n=1 Tax=Muraenolepis orangiensis TaxID=630683 RepID=A0A9Q0IP53_9TELE|nr:hypothetical protein NHX12_028787 [Muraenolepis orangiensis]